MAESSANWLALDLDPGTAEFFGLPQRLYVPVDPESPLYSVDRNRISIDLLARGLERAIQENPDAMDRADLLRFVRRWPAIADLDRFVRVDNPTFAQRVARDLLRDDPGDPVPLAVLGWLAARQGQWAEGRTATEQALERAPTHAPLQLQLALILAGAEDVEGSADLLRDLTNHPRYQSMARLWLREIQACSAPELQARLRTGLEAFQSVLHADNPATGWQTLAQAFPENPEVLYARAVRPGGDPSPEEREQLLRSTLAADPDHVLATSALGLILKGRGRAEEALDLFDILLTRQPRTSLPRADRGQTLELLGRSDEALQDYRAVFQNPLAQIPEAALLTAGVGLVRLAPIEEATRTLEEAAIARPGDALPPRILARIEESVHGTEAAERLLRRALRDCGPNPALNYALGDLLRRAGRRVEAEGLFKALVKRHPESALGHRGLGDLEVAQQPGKAVEHYARAESLDPLSPIAGFEYLRGVAALRAGRAEDATQCLGRATAVEPGNARYWCDLGAARFYAGDLTGAVRATERAHQLEPEQPGFMHNLATFYLADAKRRPWRLGSWWRAWSIRRGGSETDRPEWTRDLWKGPGSDTSDEQS